MAKHHPSENTSHCSLKSHAADASLPQGVLWILRSPNPNGTDAGMVNNNKKISVAYVLKPLRIKHEMVAT